MAKQYTLTYDSYNNWTLPLNLAIGFHILLVFSIVYLPDLLKPRPKFEDIYTVNLIEVSEPAPVQEAAPPQQEAPEPEPEPEPVKDQKLAPVLEPIKPVPPAPKEVKAVSIKPLKRKIKKKVVKPDNRQKELDRIKRQRLAEALQAEKQAAEQARLAAEEAERQQKLMEQQLAAVRNQVRSTPARPTTQRKSSGARSALSTQYHGAIMNHVTQYWSLPEFKNWDLGLSAIVVVTIAKNGSIQSKFFEKRSGDSAFDQYVRKTLQDADPFPPIPAALRKNQIEIGLRFRPGSIQ